MKVTRVITKELELNLKITEATLLTIEEAEQLPEKLKNYNRYWWLRSHGYTYNFAANVIYGGSVSSVGSLVSCYNYAVRPALIISNLKSSCFRIGDTFKFGNKDFEIISNDRAFCLGDIGYSLFREDWRADDANNYEKSDVKKFIDEWFEKSIEEVNSKENEVKVVNNKNESIYKCKDCRSELRCPCDPNSDACGFFYPTNRFLIKTEESLLEKFFSEENKPLSPQEIDVLLYLIEKDLNKRKKKAR